MQVGDLRLFLGIKLQEIDRQAGLLVRFVPIRCIDGKNRFFLYDLRLRNRDDQALCGKVRFLQSFQLLFRIQVTRTVALDELCEVTADIALNSFFSVFILFSGAAFLRRVIRRLRLPVRQETNPVPDILLFDDIEHLDARALLPDHGDDVAVRRGLRADIYLFRGRAGIEVLFRRDIACLKDCAFI